MLTLQVSVTSRVPVGFLRGLLKKSGQLIDVPSNETIQSVKAANDSGVIRSLEDAATLQGLRRSGK